MSIVSTSVHTLQPQRPQQPLLEVVVTHPRDVAGADEGGADRLFVVDRGAAVGSARQDAGPAGAWLSPAPAVVSAICKETELPVRVMLRLNDSWTTTGGELNRMVGLAESYLSVGAEGVAFGFLDRDLLVDVEICRHVAGQLPGVPWTFHHAIDAVLEPERAWRAVADLSGLDAVLSAGSPRGLEVGHQDLTDRASASPTVAALLMAGGGLQPEHVPWLVRAGVSKFQVGSSVRPGRSWDKAYVDARHVRAWRLLVDDATARAVAPPAPVGQGLR
jgi:copper homeostasis protein